MKGIKVNKTPLKRIRAIHTPIVKPVMEQPEHVEESVVEITPAVEETSVVEQPKEETVKKQPVKKQVKKAEQVENNKERKTDE